jgi:C1A family cysteine protease
MKVLKSESSEKNGTGWLPPRPDLRDYTESNKEILALSIKLGIKEGKMELPPSVDLRKWCSPVENQGELGSCTAHAGMGIIEYYEKKAFGKHLNGSRLFLYKTTRNLMQTSGDSGAELRSTMGAIVLCGVPAEKFWPYKVEDFDVEPDPFVYSIAKNFSNIKYFSHDAGLLRALSPEPSASSGFSLSSAPCALSSSPSALSPSPINRIGVLDSVRKYLNAGVPSMFGFWGFPSFEKSDVRGGIPYPCDGESAEWGHAIVAVGYDDEKKITNTIDQKVRKGALLIRNSWGTSWGDKGYGWLPYDYVTNGLATDFWSLLSMEWVETGQFGV